MPQPFKTTVLNLFGGPDAGKSTFMAAVFAELKFRGRVCEMAPEWIKANVWEGREYVLGNQIYVFGKQYHTLERLRNKVDIIVTDSPLLLSLVYGKPHPEGWRPTVYHAFDSFDNVNVFLNRARPYSPHGRMQSEAEAIEKDNEIKRELLEFPFVMLDSVRESIPSIVDLVLNHRARKYGERS